MVSWNNLDTLSSYKELTDVKPACLTEVMSGDNGEFGVLNMTYVDKQSHVTSIEDDVYSYFTEVTVQSTIKGADKEASTGHIVVTYSIDKAGNISHLNGFTIAD